MNTPNPLVPQGSLHSRQKSTVRTAFFAIAAIHLVFFGGLLIQGGCKKSEDKPIMPAEDTNVLSLPPMTSDVVVTEGGTNVIAPSLTNPPTQLPPPAVDVNVPPVPALEEMKEYVVTKGDSFSSIAKKTGASIKAIEQANPGVSSSKLQI